MRSRGYPILKLNPLGITTLIIKITYKCRFVNTLRNFVSHIGLEIRWRPFIFKRTAPLFLAVFA
ncbi:MAG: hypothetical protein A3G37_00645 [Omnitrophica WOR_2 bacterium RIFCSPLOWO2_12_FULL_46_30]|nr:MAG: hypothetical protein A3D27_02890 [Omnitrophica WOR_2 bacterium RIFCSPHIGHO2_02_FULL_46_37]OGX51282.1 MAG: hypothetical protein A3G37_00645 [Omnitrophica WOR_2 bacterium RIFCSPLOWO2_12_FULL_46_30]